MLPLRARAQDGLGQRTPKVRSKMRPTKIISVLPAALALAALTIGANTGSTSAAEPNRFCEATATTAGVVAKDQFMAWCEAEALGVPIGAGTPVRTPMGHGRALRN